MRTRAQRGVIILSARAAVVQVVVLGGQIALARLLGPRDFGIFAIVHFALSFFVFFGDAGLGGALIQQRKQPSQRELSSVFFVQLFIALAVVLVVALTAGFARFVWPDLPEGGPWLLRALSLEFLLTTLRTIPCILMERDLLFGRLAVLDLLLTLAFYAVAPALAWMGFGAWSLVAAVLAQGVVGFVAAQIMRPFRPFWVIDRDALRPVLKFGMPYQLNRAVGFVNGAVTPIYAGSKLGSGPLGFINWAQTTAYFPLKLVEIFSRIAFPLYSRLQGEEKLLGESFGRTVQLCAAFTTFFVALFLGLGAEVIHVVFGDKWMPALPLLHVYAVAIAFGFFAPLVGSVLEATGRPGLLFRLAIFWTTLNWVAVPIGTALFGIEGFSIAYSLHVIVGNLALFLLLHRLVPHARLMRRLAAPLVAGLVTYAGSRYVGSARGTDSVFLVLMVFALACVHLAALFAVDRRGMSNALSIIPSPASA